MGCCRQAFSRGSLCYKAGVTTVVDICGRVTTRRVLADTVHFLSPVPAALTPHPPKEAFVPIALADLISWQEQTGQMTTSVKNVRKWVVEEYSGKAKLDTTLDLRSEWPLAHGVGRD